MKITKKYKKEIEISTIFIIVTVLVCFVGLKSGINGESLEDVTNLAFNSLISVIGMWISGYFILIQLYKNTYPMEVIEKSFLKKAKLIIGISVIGVITGIYVLTIGGDLISRIYFLIIFVLDILLILGNIYFINRNFTLNTYIEKDFKSIEKMMKTQKIDREKIDKLFKKMRKIFEECVTKEEFYVCSNIAKKNYEFFQVLIENCHKLFKSANENDQELAEYILEKIIDENKYQVVSLSNTENSSVMKELFFQQEENIKLCLRIKNVEWFKRYVYQINLLAREYEKENIIKYLYAMNQKICEKLVETDEENFLWYINEIFGMNISLKYLYKGVNLKYLGQLLIMLLMENIENKKINQKQYKALMKYLKLYTLEITRISDNIDDITTLIEIYGLELLEKERKDSAVELIEILTDEDNLIVDNVKWNEFILYYLNKTMDNWEDLGVTNRRKIIDLILELTLKNSRNSYFSFLPKYEVIVYNNRDNIKEINQIYDEIREILIRLIINNNENMFYYVLRKLEKTILKLEKKDRNAQEKLFKLYIYILLRTINIENKKFIELVLSIIKETVEELDKDRKISDQLGNEIIESISKIAGVYKSNMGQEYNIYIIRFLYSFLDGGEELCFISNYNDKKKLLYRSMYNIGLRCIENNMEKALREVSNALGWFIIRSLKNDNQTLTNYLIERTNDLYKIAQNMQISEKTIIFIMTLFTTVGTFCCKEPSYEKFLQKILRYLSTENFTRIKTAIELRTKENDMWDNLYDNKTEQLTEQFLKKLQSK